MKEPVPQQQVIDISYTEQELLNQAIILINKALLLDDSSSVRKYEFLFKDYDALQYLQALQSIGNLMYLNKWDNLLIESHKAVWKMNYKFVYPPT